MYRIIGADGREYGPVNLEQLLEWRRQGRVGPQTQVRSDSSSDWQSLSAFPELNPPPAPAAQPFAQPPSLADRASKKIAAGVCGIVIGALGIHKFILGYTGPGLIMLLVTVLSCGLAAPVFGIIGLIEGILYLTKTDEEFVRTYVDNRKDWF